MPFCITYKTHFYKVVQKSLNEIKGNMIFTLEINLGKLANTTNCSYEPLLKTVT